MRNSGMRSKGKFNKVEFILVQARILLYTDSDGKLHPHPIFAKMTLILSVQPKIQE
jgi:hypothetical protein